MKRATVFIALMLLSGFASAQVVFAQGKFTVVPSAFDPHGTHLVAAEWEGGIGCPTNAVTRPFNNVSPFNLLGPTPYTDPACMTGDPSGDARVQGLLLAKTGPTNDDAAGTAVLVGVNGMTLNELGYDIRKPGPPAPDDATLIPGPGDPNDPRGSHCGAGAPRFDIFIKEDSNNVYFIGCNSPPPDVDSSGVGAGWQRLRWGGAALLAFSSGCPDPNVACDIKGKTVKSIAIVFDEGQDHSGGPDSFGLAVLDNIDVNGALVGKGPEENENKDEDRAQGDDGKGDSFQSEDSPSRPETSSMSYEDQSQGMKMQSVNGASSITYSGTCVTYAGDAVLNGNPGYLFTFEACDLSALGTGIGDMSMTVTGPLGFLYQKSAVLTSGYVSIHPH